METPFKQILFSTIFLVMGSSSMARVLHVSKDGNDCNIGNESSPFASISKAASIAIANDTVMIHKGIYREWVSPANTGINPSRRITYMPFMNDKVEIKGSEIVNTWKKENKTIWVAEVPNSLFSDFNPFAINLSGDWLQKGRELHLGEVYLNNHALMEVDKEDVLKNTPDSWFAIVKGNKTIIKANFSDKNPNKSIAEINVRPACFFPKTTGINYITIKGISLSQAATQWSAPTSEQIGTIGPNWSKGWIIENCEVSNSKCVGICLGKERASGHNMWSLYRKKNGYMKCGFNREIESILKAYDLGWNKENIGSHLVQNNIIHDCGQSGIVGHMGAAFSIIKNNEIYNINRTDGKIKGAETAGIKIHAAIDAKIEHNIISNSVIGLWLDWQAQGTQVANNILFDNEQQDMFIEVSHGPTLVYNNICLSELSLLINAQGIAFFNNLIGGKVKVGSSSERYTPYHEAHSTKVKGLFNNNGGDLRFYNNIFLGNASEKTKGENGLSNLDRFPVYSEHLSDSIRNTKDYLSIKFPVWCSNNIYFNKAKPYKNEINSKKFLNSVIKAEIDRANHTYSFKQSLDLATLKKVNSIAVNTGMLGQTFISEALFDNPDCTDFYLGFDIQGNQRDMTHPIIGPFEFFVNEPIWGK